MLMRNEPLNFKGKWFNLQRGFTLRFQPIRDHIPIYIASFRPRAVKVVAEIGDGWMPIMIPIQRLKGEVDKFLGYARKAGRDAADLTIRSPGGVTVTKDRGGSRQGAKANTAFYVARMGDFYYQQLSDMGFADECNEIRRAWREGGSGAGYAAVTDEMQGSLGAIGSVEECRDWLQRQEEAGVSLHTVSIAGTEAPVAEGRLIEQLMR
jgi:alkanesulfonate monooxygenase SsuD/methylene tetrahydromethanopterin reductase-like flavin-dependent oxidoreductase (luciferase family)